MSYRTEFPDYDDELPRLECFEDTSWHNDECPSLGNDAGWKVYCDYKNPDRWAGDTRYAVSNPDCETVLETNNFSEVVAFFN